jgi:hypothetical protein
VALASAFAGAVCSRRGGNVNRAPTISSELSQAMRSLTRLGIYLCDGNVFVQRHRPCRQCEPVVGDICTPVGKLASFFSVFEMAMPTLNF